LVAAEQVRQTFHYLHGLHVTICGTRGLFTLLLQREIMAVKCALFVGLVGYVDPPMHA
jgi:hypothetical protein